MTKGQETQMEVRKTSSQRCCESPWQCVCINLTVPYTLKVKDGTVMGFMCLTMINPTSGRFETIEFLNASIECKKK